MIGNDSYHIVIDLSSSSTPSTTTLDCRGLDYRYSNIEVVEIEVKNIRNHKQQDMAMAKTIEPIRAKSIGNGVIRLYREFEHETDLDGEGGAGVTRPGDDSMVAILAIPTYFTATDLLGYIGEAYMNGISHIRILKSEKPNRFLVLIKFRDIIKAAEFQYHFDGKNFNSMEPETCHVVYVKSVQLYYPHKNEEMRTLIPFLLQDPFTSPSPPSPPPPSQPPSQNKETIDTQLSHVSSNVLLELPTCPVCLEKMDATITGLFTIPCQHTFHCQCLSKWRDDSCPVCRYSHNLANADDLRQASGRFRRLSRSSETTSTLLQNTTLTEDPECCMECKETSNLWICLVCGNIGCSRYAPEQHSLKHFITTGHCFAMEISTSRVWDYAGDNYVHRLVTNESDGKLVELPEKDVEDSAKTKVRAANNIDKVDAVGFEYSQLLISQLASQREYYEELLLQHREMQDTKSRKGVLSNSNVNSELVTDLEITIEDLSAKVTDLTTKVIPSLKEKIQTKEERLSSVGKELATLNSLNDALSKKVDYLTNTNVELKGTIEKLKKEKGELNEQVKDLMFFLDSNEKFKNEPEDVKQGTVVIQQPTKSSSSSISSSKKKKKQKK
ncbi:hypothetical protein KGF56_001748 [Candida oxycetoniae]|uniref:Uncharacterized protein n=1 Tax=Candida oxycetoniae TaxID=497107 RepID=A0AAI9SYV5_9ASCO|nr:uncharacterized protein KGF56_001748 [Candida oxycetoniae]KAI3405449.2 hypothetical protein KGF56_001748 [Candida oxycetoniae]